MTTVPDFEIIVNNENYIMEILSIVYENKQNNIYVHFKDNLNIDHRINITPETIESFWSDDHEPLKQSIIDYVNLVKS
jgi:hypothetical protein